LPPERDRRIWPLYAAGFTTGSARTTRRLGGDAGGASSLLYLGVLAGAVRRRRGVLKPSSALADRIGAARCCSAASSVRDRLRRFVLVDDSGWIWVARLAQGAAASAFSPAASVLVARLNPAAKRGRAFGSYGFFKSIGYTLGPLPGRRDRRPRG